MQRNGKSHEPITTVLEAPASLLQVPDSPLHTPDSLLQVPDSHLQASNGLLQISGRPARPSKQRLNAYRADDPIERRFMAAQVTIENLLTDSKLLDMLAPYGYDTARILQGQALYKQALALYKEHRASMGNQFAAADSRLSAQKQAHTSYKRHVAFARIALGDNRGAAQKLDLSARKRTQAGWMLQAEQFYTNALADQAIIAKLAGYGVTYTQLLMARDLVAAVATGIVTQQNYKHIAQEVKQARDTALQALNRWMQDLMAVARITLAD